MCLIISSSSDCLRLHHQVVFGFTGPPVQYWIIAQKMSEKHQCWWQILLFLTNIIKDLRNTSLPATGTQEQTIYVKVFREVWPQPPPQKRALDLKDDAVKPQNTEVMWPQGDLFTSKYLFWLRSLSWLWPLHTNNSLKLTSRPGTETETWTPRKKWQSFLLQYGGSFLKVRTAVSHLSFKFEVHR